MLHARSPQGYARLAGVCYLLIFVFAIMANLVVLESLIVSGDGAATAANIEAGEARFRLAAASMVVVLIADVVIAWALLVVVGPAHAALAALMVLFRLVYTIAHIEGVSALMSALRASNGALGIEGAGAVALPALTAAFADSHGVNFTITLIFFGVHLMLLGFLIVRSRLLPVVIGGLVVLAGLGYAVDGFLWVAWAGYRDLPSVTPLIVVIAPALIGEGALMIWLIVRGVRVDVWRRLAEARRAAG